MYFDLVFIDDHNLIESWLIDITTDVRLNVEEHFLKGENVTFREKFENWVQLEHFAFYIQLHGDINSFEEIETKNIEVLKIGNLARESIP